MKAMGRKTILITGVSSGIGLAAARLLRSSENNVVATCRLTSLCKIPPEITETENFCVIPLDVIDHESRRAAVVEATNRFGPIDVLINNAAVSFRSATEDMDEEDDLLQLSTNYLGPLALIRLVLPSMRERRKGLIINVSSVGGMMAMPLMGSYSASKFALEGASESLWYELKPWNISVVLVQPGFIHSDSFQRVLKGRLIRERGESASFYRRVYSEMSNFIERGMRNARSTPESVAERIVRLIDDPNPPLRIPATIDAHLFGLIRRFVPRRFYHYFLYRALPGVKHWSDQ